ncbi:MAG: alpha/beta hydrolase [Betaproteobacteria bacterium]|nr:MAG: alpha/beta hydrolase [Betaproteobacteria bacterium]
MDRLKHETQPDTAIGRATMGVPAASERFCVQGVDLAVSREGSGVPVICLHAIAHGGADYDAFARAIGPGFEIIRVDWPGHGRSGSDSRAVTPARYAQLLGELLPRLRVHEPVVIGNSIGGAAAILLAATHPVRALVLCDSGGLVRVSRLVRVFCRAFAAFFAAGARGAWWYRPLFALWYRRMVLLSPAATAQRERVIDNAVAFAPVLKSAWLGFASAEADLRATAIGLDVPIWIAWARSDRVVPLSLSMPCIRRMKRARVSTFKGGHAPFLEQPAEFAEQFAEFIHSLEEQSHVNAQSR